MKTLILLAALVSTVSIANADRWRTAGTRGTVTAYDLDGRTVLEHRTCFRRAGGYDYSSCSDRLRDGVKLQLCTRLGAGTHHFYYQLGDLSLVRSSVFCTRR